MDGFDNLRNKWMASVKPFMEHSNITIFTPHLIYSVFDFIAEKYNVTGEALLRLKMSSAIMDKITEQRFGKGKEHLTSDEYLELFSWYILKKPALFKTRTTQLYSTVFDILDLDKDGFISMDEFNFFYKVTGQDKTHAPEAFRLLDANKDGMISREEYLDAFVKFMFDPTVTYEDLPLF